MNIPQIQIDTNSAVIGVSKTPSKKEIVQKPAELSIEQPEADIKFQKQPGRLTIDQTKAWENLDLKSIRKRIEEFAVKGKEDLLEGIARRAQEGDELMRIENKGNPIADIAKRNSTRLKMEMDMGDTPAFESVDISYQPSRLQVEVQVNKPVIDVQTNSVIHNYQPGRVSIYMKQYPEIQFGMDMKV